MSLSPGQPRTLTAARRHRPDLSRHASYPRRQRHRRRSHGPHVPFLTHGEVLVGPGQGVPRGIQPCRTALYAPRSQGRWIPQRFWNPSLVRLHQSPARIIARPIVGDEDVRSQVERMLSLDVDGRPFDAIDDRVVADLRGERAGLRPLLFPTPYEAACWAVLTQRTRQAQALAARTWLCRHHGHRFEHDGVEHLTFPAPDVLRSLATIEGVTSAHAARLRAVADAACNGLLDPADLRRVDAPESLRGLRTIDGIGPFGAELVLVRGAGAPDHFPLHEPVLHAAMARRYGFDDPDTEELAAIADRWRPRRSWAALLLRLGEVMSS